MNSEALSKLTSLKRLICYSEQLFEDAITILPPQHIMFSLLLYRKITERSFGIYINAKNGLYGVCNTIVRDLFENELYLRYMLEKDTELRSLTYHIGWLRIQLDIKNRVKKKIKNKNDEFVKHLRTVFTDEYLENSINDIYKDLRSDGFSKINSDWDELEKTNRKRYNWYSLYSNIFTLSKLAKHFNKENEYHFVYQINSLNTHSLNALSQLKMDGTLGTILSPRNYVASETYIDQAIQSLWDTTDLILHKFYPERIEHFNSFIFQNLLDKNHEN